MNHDYDNCNFHRDEAMCDCSPCYECNIMAPEKYNTSFRNNDEEIHVCDNCISEWNEKKPVC